MSDSAFSPDSQDMEREMTMRELVREANRLKVCPECHKRFAAFITGRYCSEECRVGAYQRREMQRYVERYLPRTHR